MTDEHHVGFANKWLASQILNHCFYTCGCSQSGRHVIWIVARANIFQVRPTGFAVAGPLRQCNEVTVINKPGCDYLELS
jgi:hypothetical protein